MHAPETDGAASDGQVNVSADGRDGAAEGAGDDFGGLLPCCDQRMTIRNPGKQGREISGCDYLQEIVEKSDEKAPSFLLVLTAVGGGHTSERTGYLWLRLIC